VAYAESVAERVRGALAGRDDVIEKRMFGGLAFMVSGHMTCGVVDTELMVRVGPECYAEALARPSAREMDFTGKPLKGFVYVAPDGFSSNADLAAWLALALDFVGGLPAK